MSGGTLQRGVLTEKFIPIAGPKRFTGALRNSKKGATDSQKPNATQAQAMGNDSVKQVPSSSYTSPSGWEEVLSAPMSDEADPRSMGFASLANLLGAMRGGESAEGSRVSTNRTNEPLYANPQQEPPITPSRLENFLLGLPVAQSGFDWFETPREKRRRIKKNTRMA